MPTIDLPSDELAAVTAAIRRVIEDDRYPHAPRLDPLRAALARLDVASKHPRNRRPRQPKPTMGRGNSKKAGRDGNRPGLVRSCSALGPAASAIACMQSWRHGETLKPLGSALVPVYGRHGPRAKAEPWHRIQPGGLWRSLRQKGPARRESAGRELQKPARLLPAALRLVQLILSFFPRPYPLGGRIDVANDRLPALGDVDVLDRHLLLAHRAVFL